MDIFNIILISVLSLFNNWTISNIHSTISNNLNNIKIENQNKILEKEKRKNKQNKIIVKNLYYKENNNKEKYNRIFQLKPFKDNLFRFKWWIIKSIYNWDIDYIDFSIKRDVEDRDEIDVKKVYDNYIEKINNDNRQDLSFKTTLWKQYYWEVKNNKINNKDVKIVLFYFHWMGGNRHQWINDYTFWWNFNRIQNLMIKNKWVYISPDFRDFTDKWPMEMFILLKKKIQEYPNAQIYLSSASSGWTLLWRLMNNEEMKNKINGIILLGSVTNLYNTIYDKNIPIYVWHWTRDPNIAYTNKIKFYLRMKNRNINYPIKIELFQWWVHGTPIRMVNWKSIINWILQQNNTFVK